MAGNLASIGVYEAAGIDLSPILGQDQVVGHDAPPFHASIEASAGKLLSNYLNSPCFEVQITSQLGDGPLQLEASASERAFGISSSPFLYFLKNLPKAALNFFLIKAFNCGVNSFFGTLKR